jgi:biopolymer transport protein ExbD
MRFARQARIFRGPLDPAPVAGVLMLLVIFIMLASLLYTPGVLIQLPTGADLTVTDNPRVVVAMDSRGQCFFENRPVQDAELKKALISALQNAGSQAKKMTLVLYADKAASNESVAHIEALAASAGIPYVFPVSRPSAFSPQQ